MLITLIQFWTMEAAILGDNHSNKIDYLVTDFVSI